MNRLLLTLTFAAMAGSVLSSRPLAAQVLPPAKRATRVYIIQGPEPESARDNSAIIRWTSNNPGGSDEHFGVVHYGTNPNELTQTAKSHIRLNQGHSETVFRVRLNDLKPATTYHYTVGSEGADDRDDGLASEAKKFTTPAGEAQQAKR
jgi:hypothetical protein